jgi:hypothetical protein
MSVVLVSEYNKLKDEINELYSNWYGIPQKDRLKYDALQAKIIKLQKENERLKSYNIKF